VRKGLLLIGALALALSLGLVACGGSSTSNPTPTKTPVATSSGNTTPTSTGGACSGTPVKITQHEGNSYFFDPKTYDFQNGKTYCLDFAVTKEFHTWTVEALGIDIFINADEHVKKDITPTKVGTFPLKCIPHEALGMTGTVTVS